MKKKENQTSLTIEILQKMEKLRISVWTSMALKGNNVQTDHQRMLRGGFNDLYVDVSNSKVAKLWV